VRQLYPNSIFPYVYEFTGPAGYAERYTMVNGRGYWGKFPGAEVNTIAGEPRPADSIEVTVGWNLLGSISTAVNTSDITSVPPGIRESSWYRYSGGYEIAAQIVPGAAYWVKTNAAGIFILSSGIAGVMKKQAETLDRFNIITIADGEGRSQTLYFGIDAGGNVSPSMYEMPPPPPSGTFDARFESKSGGLILRAIPVSGMGTEFPILVQADAFPLSVSWKIRREGATYELSDGLGGKAFAPRTMRAEGGVTITNHGSHRIVVKVSPVDLLPSGYELLQNYPNPFNPATEIRFALPAPGIVTMEVYDLNGRLVRTLVNEARQAGNHAVIWDGRSNDGHLSGSGIYFARLSVTAHAPASPTGGSVRSFSSVRKLMMVK